MANDLTEAQRVKLTTIELSGLWRLVAAGPAGCTIREAFPNRIHRMPGLIDKGLAQYEPNIDRYVATAAGRAALDGGRSDG